MPMASTIAITSIFRSANTILGVFGIKWLLLVVQKIRWELFFKVMVQSILSSFLVWMMVRNNAIDGRLLAGAVLLFVLKSGKFKKSRTYWHIPLNQVDVLRNILNDLILTSLCITQFVLFNVLVHYWFTLGIIIFFMFLTTYDFTINYFQILQLSQINLPVASEQRFAWLGFSSIQDLYFFSFCAVSGL